MSLLSPHICPLHYTHPYCSSRITVGKILQATSETPLVQLDSFPRFCCSSSDTMWSFPDFHIPARQVDIPQKQRKGSLPMTRIVPWKRTTSRNPDPRAEQHWGPRLASTGHEGEAHSSAGWGGLPSQWPRPTEWSLGLSVLDPPVGWLQRISQALHSTTFPPAAVPTQCSTLFLLHRKTERRKPGSGAPTALHQGWLGLISRKATDLSLCFSF